MDILIAQLITLGTVEKTVVEQHLQVVSNVLLNMESELRFNPHNTSQQSALYNIHKKDLYKIAQILRRFSRTKAHGTTRTLMSLLDVLEKGFLYKTNTEKILLYIANVFAEFLKGITFFASNTNINRPIYHRNQSCGQRDELHELDCSNIYDNPEEFSKRSAKVRNCYIERLVYDEIFSHFFPSKEQNYAHKAMALNTGRNINKFESCFPNTALSVEISWSHDKCFPIALRIYTTSAAKTKVETYTKDLNAYNISAHNIDDIQLLDINVESIYKDNVHCKRLLYDLETHIHIINDKIQSFSSIMPWHESHITTYRRHI